MAMYQGQLRSQRRMEAIRDWLRDHLPDERPRRMYLTTWQLLRAFADGASVDGLVTRSGRTREHTVWLIREGARRCGYVEPPLVAWVRADGTVAPEAIDHDPVMGCDVWLGTAPENDRGPKARLPVALRPEAERQGNGPMVVVRRYLWEQAGRELGPEWVLVGRCGDWRCIALDHQEPQRVGTRLRRAAVESLIEHKDRETPDEAAARVGASRSFVDKVRGPGGKRVPKRSELRGWLAEAMPAERPPAISERDWACAQAFAGEQTLEQIAKAEGVSRQMIHIRVRRVAEQLQQVGMTSASDDDEVALGSSSPAAAP
jgi:hypothetical protein